MMCASTVQVAAQPGGVVSNTGKRVFEDGGRDRSGLEANAFSALGDDLPTRIQRRRYGCCLRCGVHISVLE